MKTKKPIKFIRQIVFSQEAARFLDSLPWGTRSRAVSALVEKEAAKKTRR